MSVHWKSYSRGIVGEVPSSSMSIFVTMDTFNSWTVRFGTMHIERKFYDVEEAKRAGVLLARDTLINTLENLADDPNIGNPIRAFWKLKEHSSSDPTERDG